MSLSQRATCHILSGHKESTSLFEAAERWQKKGGCNRDHGGEGKSEIQRKEKEKKSGGYKRKNGEVFRKERKMRKRKRRGTEEFF